MKHLDGNSLKINIKLPAGLKIGQAIADGNCFFDSFRQGLEQLGTTVTVQELRHICQEFARNEPPQWFIDSIANNYDNNGEIYKETPTEYVMKIMDSDRWGDCEIEGRILCKFYSIKLSVIEKQKVKGEELWLGQITDELGSISVSINNINYYAENTIHIINTGMNHFEPILNNEFVRRIVQPQPKQSIFDNSYDFINNNADCSQSEISSSLDDIEKEFYVTQVSSNNNQFDKCLHLSSWESFENEYQNLYTKNEKIINYNKRENKYYIIINKKYVDVDLKDIDKIRRKNLYLQALRELQNTIRAGEIDYFKKLCNLISSIHKTEDNALLYSFYSDDNNSIKSKNLIILSCECNQPILLNYLLNESQILYYLSNVGHIIKSDVKQMAFYHAMCSVDIKLLEILYDYWSGNLHWLAHETRYDEKHVVYNLKVLNQLLINASNDYKKRLVTTKKMYQQMVVDIHSIIKFNLFQIELYSELSKLRVDSKLNITNLTETKNRKHEIDIIKNMIFTVFHVYEKYSDEEEVRLQKISPTEEAKIKELLLDKSTLYWRYIFYTMYQMYFRKLDFNVSLLILDNLYLLKQRLKMPDKSYQKIESKLYYFIYHVSKDWDFYLPKRREKYSFVNLVLHDNSLAFAMSIIDQDRLDYSAIIYLERRDFRKCLYKFKDELVNVNILENIRERFTKIPDEELNTLTVLPYLRDDFSLRKIVYYLKELSFIDLRREKQLGQLIIERILQVIGEFLKSTDESLHLLPTTEALLQAEIPIDTIKRLKNLRDLLSHVDKGQLLTRIEIEDQNDNLFMKILEDLLELKKGICEVIKIHKSRVYKSLIQNGLYLLGERFNEMPKELSNIAACIYFESVTGLKAANCHFMLQQFEEDFLSNHPRLTKKLLTEAEILKNCQNKLAIKRTNAGKHINNITIRKFTQYIVTIRRILFYIHNQNNNWDCIKHFLLQLNINVSIFDYPNENDANKIKKLLKSDIILENKENILSLKEKLKLVQDLNPQWSFIKKLLEFIVIEVNIFVSNPFEIKKSAYTCYFENKIANSVPSKQGLSYINHQLKTIEEELIRLKKNFSILPEDILPFETDKFEGIKQLEIILNQNNFISKDEKETIINNISAEKKEINFAKSILTSHFNKEIILERQIYERLINLLEIKKQNKEDLKSGYDDTENFISYQSLVKDSHNTYEDLLHKLNENIPINKKDHTRFVTYCKLNNKSEKILLNLVLGENRNPKLLHCLRNRITLLKNVLLDTDETLMMNHLVFRYINDKKFRAIVEVLLVDIMNILKETKQKKSLNKISKLLADINLRNILEHGNVLLEIVGNVLDSNDLPTELISKALVFIKDEKSINSLCTLIEMDIDPNKFKNNQIEMLTPEQQNLVIELKQSNNWQDYLQLICTDYQQQTQKGDKKVLEQIDNQKDEHLLKSVKEKNVSGTENFINRGANVNYIDCHGKAALHYAAMCGSKEIIQVLLNNNANINITDKKYGRSSLHFAAMNGHKEAVRILLVKGANVCVTDKNGQGPLYYAYQRNHNDILDFLICNLTLQVGYCLKQFYL